MSNKLEKDTNQTIKKDSSIEMKEVKKEIKKPIRRATLEYNGATYLDDKYKKPGKRYRAVADRPGRIQYMESLGYEIVRDDDFESGDAAKLAGSKLGSAQTLEMGKSKSDPGIWMCIDEDLWTERQELKNARNNEAFNVAVEAGQRPDQRGR